jgi:hypothetical protein
MKKIATVILLLVLSSAACFAADLYFVNVNSHNDAAALNAAGVEVVARVNDGYLILVETARTDQFTATGLEMRLLYSDVSREQIRIERRYGHEEDLPFPILFERVDQDPCGLDRAELPGSSKTKVFDLRTE